MTETLPDSVRHAETAYEAVRALNHLTQAGALPGPVAYELLGSLKALCNSLPQAFGQIGNGLTRSQEELNVFEDDGGDPVARTATAVNHLIRAAELADQLADELAVARSAVSRQRYRATR